MVVGSNPAPATKKRTGQRLTELLTCFFVRGLVSIAWPLVAGGVVMGGLSQRVLSPVLTADMLTC